MHEIAITTYYLEITAPEQLRAQRSDRSGIHVARIETPQPELNRFFYASVGANYYWLDRLRWSEAEWLRYLDRPELETWILSVAGIPAGYFEQELAADGSAEIVYFGLRAPYIGQGLGGHLLTHAIERGFQRGANRVWLHTCSLDHPAALAHYQARGMRIYRTEAKHKLVPSNPDSGPWAEARSATS